MGGYTYVYTTLASKVTWSTPTVIVATLALAFTLGSFWFLNARRGRIKSFAPHTFAAQLLQAGVILRFPLVFQNTGAVPIVIQDLRLEFDSSVGPIQTLPWRTTRSQLKPAPGDGHALPAVFSIEGRKTLQLFVEFGALETSLAMQARPYQMTVMSKLGHRKKWKKLISFTLNASHITDPVEYLAYSNDTNAVTDSDVTKARANFEKLNKRLNAGS